jgi:hypothetical protein
VAYYADPENTKYVVQKTSRTADELRDRIGAHLLVQLESGPAFALRLVTQRTRNFEFQGFRRTDSAGELSVRVPF